MNRDEAAARLDGNKYREEGSPALWAEMKAASLVAVYGASDDLMEFDGAISDEFGAYDGGTAYVTSTGKASSKRLKSGASIRAVWCAEGGLSWTYKTKIPHATFTIVEDGEPYCRGIVFALADVPAAESHS